MGRGGIICTAQRLESLHSHCGQETGTTWGWGRLLACLLRSKASRSMPHIHGGKLVGQWSFQEWTRERRSLSPGQVVGRWIW